MSNSSPPPANDDSPESETLGGADAIEKTTYIVGIGTDPSKSARSSIPPVGSSYGSPLLWVTIVIAALVAIIYSLGILA